MASRAFAFRSFSRATCSSGVSSRPNPGLAKGTSRGSSDGTDPHHERILARMADDDFTIARRTAYGVLTARTSSRSSTASSTRESSPPMKKPPPIRTSTGMGRAVRLSSSSASRPTGSRGRVGSAGAQVAIRSATDSDRPAQAPRVCHWANVDDVNRPWPRARAMHLRRPL
jgi:hypothetical protein